MEMETFEFGLEVWVEVPLKERKRKETEQEALPLRWGQVSFWGM